MINLTNIMNIIYISNSIIPSKTANSIHVMKMAQAFSQLEHQVTLLAPKRFREIEQGVDDIYSFYGVKNSFQLKKLSYGKVRFLRTLNYAIQVLRYLKNKKPDLVYSRDLLGALVSIKLGKRTVFELHSPIENIIGKIIFKNIIKDSSLLKVVSITESLKKFIVSDLNIDTDRVVVIPDGADRVSQKNLSSKATLLGKKENIKVGYIGSLYRGKGIELIELIQDKLPSNIDIHIIGGSSEQVTRWRESIKNRQIYFYGFKPQNSISKYINSMDICLLPNQKKVFAYGSSKNKGQNISDFTSPLKLFEYMAHKKAIISSDLAVLKEILTDNYNAILVPPENADKWINAIEELSENIEKREKLSNNALKDFLQYSWYNRAKKILQI